MVDVGVVRVLVPHGEMRVPVRVRLRAFPSGLVIVLMMLIVLVPMAVSERLVAMLVLVALAKV